MSQIDDRIVELTWDGKQFEEGARQSLNTIEELKQATKFEDLQKNLSDFSKNATKGFDLSKIQNGLDVLKERFSITGIAGMEVIKRLTNFAIDAGKSITGALTKPLAQIYSGGQNRARNIDQAKFQIEGLKIAWADLYGSIDEAVSGTAYGLDAAAKAAAQLSASGVGAGESMTKALRGISGVAAMANTSYEEISPIFTTVAGQGKLMTMQLRQLESRGLNVAAELGKALGKTEQEIREMVTKGKIDFKTFSYAMDDAFGEHAKDANKTFEGAMLNIQAALSRIGAEFWSPYREAAIPVFNQIRLLINAIKGDMGPLFTLFKDFVYMFSNILTNKILKFTNFIKNDFTGIENVANGFRNIGNALVRIFVTIGSAFREVFGSSKSLGDTVNGLAEGFESLTEKLVPSDNALIIFRNVLTSVLSVVKNVWSIIKPFVSFIANIASWFIKLDMIVISLITKFISFGVQLAKNSKLWQTIQKSGGLVAFTFEKLISAFIKIRSVLSDNTTFLGKFATGLKNVATTLGAILLGGLFVGITKLVELFKYIKGNFPQIIDNIKTKFSEFVARLKEIPIFAQAFEHLKFIFEAIKDKASGLISIVKALFTSFTGGGTRAGQSLSPLQIALNIILILVSKLIPVFKLLGTVASVVFMGLTSIFNTVMSFIRGLNFGAAIDKIKELVNKVKDLEIVRTAIDAFNSSGGNLIEVFKAVIGKIKEFVTSLHESGSSVLEYFVDKIKNVAKAIAEFFKSFSGKNGGDEVTRSIEGKASIFDFFKDKFVKVKDIIVSGLQKIRDEGLLTKVLMVAYVLAILKALISIPNSFRKMTNALTGEEGLFTSLKGIALNVSTFVDTLKDNVNAGTGLFGSLKDAVTNWGKAQRKSKIELLGGLLKDIAISIGILAASLAVLSLVPSDKLERTAIILGIFSGVLIALAAAITYASKTNLVKDTWFSSFAANILAMTISIGILGGLLIAFSKIGVSDIWQAIGILGIVMLLMVAMGKVMELMAGKDFSGTTLRSAIFMIAFALAIKSLAETLSGLADIKIANMDSFIIALVGLFGGMAVIIAASSSISPASALTVIAIVWALGKMIQAFKDTFANIDFKDLSKVLIEAKTEIMVIIMFLSAMVAIITIAALEVSVKLALAGAKLSKGLLQVGLAFALFGVGLLMIQSAIRKISEMELDLPAIGKISLVLLAILSAFAIVMLINKFLGKDLETAVLKVSASLLLLSLTMFNVVVIAHMVKNLEGEAILKALGILLSIVVMMSIIILAVKSGNGTLAFKTVMATVIGMGLMIGALLVLGLMCSNDKVFQDLLKGLALILAVCLGLSLVLMQVSKIHTGQSWKPMLMMILMFGAVFGALYLLSQNLGEPNDLLKLLAISGIIIGTIAALIALTTAITKFAKKNDLGKSKAVTKAVAALAVMLGAFIAVAVTLGLFAAATKNIGALDMAVKAAAVLGTLYVLIKCAEEMTKMTKNFKMSNIGKFALMMGTMILAFAAVSAIVLVIGNIPVGEGLLTKILAISLVFAELVGLSLLMGKFGEATSKTFAAIGALALMTVIFGLVSAICLAIGMVPVGDGLLAKTQIIMLVLVELIAINSLLGLIGAEISGKGALASLALIPMIVIFGLLSAVCLAIGLVPAGTDLLAKTQIIMLVLVELAAINALLGLLVAQEGLGALGSLALLPMIIVFTLLSAVCLAIGLVPTQDGLLEKTQIIMLVLVELVAINALLGLLVAQEALGAVASVCLIPLILIFTLLSVLCTVISMLPMEGVLEKTQPIMLVLVEMVGILALLGIIAPLTALALIAIPGLIAVCAALLVLVGSVKLLENTGSENIKSILDQLTDALFKVVEVGLAATAAVVGLVGLGAAILLMGVACLAAGEGVKLFAEGIEMLSSTTPQQMEALQTTILTFCNSIAVGITTIITSTGEAIITAIDTIINGIIDVISGAIGRIFSAGEESGSSLLEGFKSTAMEILKIPADIVSGLISGIGSIVGSLYEAGKSMGGKIVEGFKEATGWHSPPEFIVKFFSDAGVAVNENADGVTNLFEGTGETWGTALKTKFNDTVGDWNFDTLKQKGLDAVNNLTNGMKLGEADFLNEINFYEAGFMRLANGRNAAAEGFSSSVGDYKYQQEMKRNRLIEKRNAIDYQHGTKAQREEYIKLNNQIGEYDNKIKDASKAMGMATDASKKLELGLDGIATGAGNAGGAVGKASGEMKNFASDLAQTLEGQMDIFSKFEKKGAMSKEELLGNMRSQIQGMSEWANDMQILAAKGIDKGLYEKLAMMGPQGAEYVGAFKEMTAEELAEANTLWAQSLVLPDQVAGQIAGAYNGIGQNMIAGEINALNAGAQQLSDTERKVQEQGLEGAYEGAGTQSPSWKTYEIGMYLMEGLHNGISDNMSRPIGIMRIVAETMIETARKTLDTKKFYDIGKNLVLGLAKGLNDPSARESLNSAVREMSNKIQALTEMANEISSPSKVFYRYGRYIVMGFANGIRENTELAAEAAKDMNNTTLDTMRNTIHSIGDILAEEMEDPVIKPVLDLTNVQSGMRTISSMFSTSQALSASALMNSQNQQLNGVVGNTVFNQYNYSPKALSRSEIYRQTRNQFSAYREALR